MNERYNLTVPREAKGRDKPYWDKVGVMFKRDKGGYSIKLHLFPDLHILAFPAEDKREHRETPAQNDPPF